MISPSIISERQIKTKDTPLDPLFHPGPYDVICIRGKVAFNHSGNIHFRGIIKHELEQYTQYKTKLDKSLAVITIVEKIRRLSPEGGFVKFCMTKNCYVEVGDQKARDKVGHALRELMNTKRRNNRHPATKKQAMAKKSVIRECDHEPSPLKTTAHRMSFSVTERFAGAEHQRRRRESFAPFSIEECRKGLGNENLLLADDIILMESCDFAVLLDDPDESFDGIFDP